MTRNHAMCLEKGRSMGKTLRPYSQSPGKWQNMSHLFAPLSLPSVCLRWCFSFVVPSPAPPFRTYLQMDRCIDADINYIVINRNIDSRYHYHPSESLLFACKCLVGEMSAVLFFNTNKPLVNIIPQVSQLWEHLWIMLSRIQSLSPLCRDRNSSSPRPLTWCPSNVQPPLLWHHNKQKDSRSSEHGSLDSLWTGPQSTHLVSNCFCGIALPRCLQENRVPANMSLWTGPQQTCCLITTAPLLFDWHPSVKGLRTKSKLQCLDWASGTQTIMSLGIIFLVLLLGFFLKIAVQSKCCFALT